MYCKELNKNFESRAEMFKALRESHEDIISWKRAMIYNSKKGDEEKCSVKAMVLDHSKLKTQVKGIDIDDNYNYIAVNTTKILDSHSDLHINGIWNKTVKEQQGKVYLLLDHEIGLMTTAVRKEHIEIFVAEIPFSILNKSYEGSTEALIYKFRKDKVINKIAADWLESGDDIQASVRMQYVKILFALNSKEDEDKEFKKTYDQYINQIANKAEFKNEIDYFWVVLEAKNILESSLVLFGSNNVTGQIEEGSKHQPSNDTDKEYNEPSNDTRQKQFYLNLLKQAK